MCGIAGILKRGGRPVGEGELLAMADSLTHRGPDDCGYAVEADVGLAMRRLQIIDLTTGNQPIYNEDRSVSVVLNGEIYNFREQRRELERRGHEFRTSSDTEVIVHLYEEFGYDCVQHLRGMFGFALWDARRRSLLVARDRLGIKPLFYSIVDDRLVFASELKAILALPEVRRELDWSAVRHLFTFLVTPPDRSIIEGVRKLEPGNLLIVEEGKEPATHRYWDLSFEPDGAATEDELVEDLRATLRETVDLHMISDVPLGAFLSGGIDSSAVVATMAGLSDKPVKTFSIGFGDADFDELEHARAVARHFGAEHRELVLEPDVFDILDDIPYYLDEPFGDSSAIPTYMVSKLAAEEVTVVLSGDGGDEVFAGYEKYFVEGRERRWDALPRAAKALAGAAAGWIPEGRPGRRFLHHHSLSGAARYLHSTSTFTADQHDEMFSPEVRRAMAPYDPWRSQRQALTRDPDDWLWRLQYNDFHHYLPLDILTKVDRMSMAHSIETRVPLLDHVLVEKAARIPSGLKLRDGSGKHVFKRAMRGILPDAILDRRKQGFAIPLEGWFRGRLDSYVRDVLLSPTAVGRGIFETGFIDKLISLNARGRPMGAELWTLISFELWCRRFLDRAPSTIERAAEPPRHAVR